MEKTTRTRRLGSVTSELCKRQALLSKREGGLREVGESKSNQWTSLLW